MDDSATKNGWFILPETMSNWPWSRHINPHYEEIKAESDAWLKAFEPFNEKSQLAFDKCDSALLAALSYPKASKEHLRTGCDLMNVFFVFDEYTDVESADVVREMADSVIDAITHPDKARPEGEILLGELARQFWARGIKTCTATSRKQFEKAFIDYLNSVVEQAADRDNVTIRTVTNYFPNRRENVGARPSFISAILGTDVPDEAFYHPVVVELSDHIADLIILDNDLASYNKEQATGDDRQNILTVVMNHSGYNLDEALRWAADYHKDVEALFFDGLKRIPSFGPDVDQQLQEYIQAITMSPRAIYCWNFESGRYFGDKGREIQRTRRVPILPKVVDNHRSLRRQDVVVPLVTL
ncbi:isoprenoid synthase domain-containing protein [Rhodofomes roseus]|uniref:Terpene synthase n=1 Tax=Rhodofomes roseus TaxID=34475 RepID=A0ABQ8KQP7_9APHY|nr:isoprenoid synthase domain-containing protein [Rhodofomes roseus]KAH9840951.1 isoprenoid synthase domain-containing protein [Rhodofomes roseus]